MEKPNSTLGGSQNLDVALDNQGNITTKSDAGTYTYHPTKIHAVTNIAIPGGGNMVFSYDNNGNMLNRNGTTLAWLTNNLPKSITKDANNSSTFQYGPHRQRWQHVYKTAGTTFTHTYVGKMTEKVVSGGVTEYKHFIHVNGESLALYSRKSTGTNATYYRHDDHLGSTEHLTDNAGANVVMESFGAYGKRRGTNWTGTPTPAELTTINNTTRKGFTEHEMLDSTDLVHMNGRVFDPLVGRFVSSDPVEGCGQNTQNPNRYAYVRNQPLIATDPTGFWPEICTRIVIYGSDFDVALGGGFSLVGYFCIDLGGGLGFWDYFGGFGGGAGPAEPQTLAPTPPPPAEIPQDMSPIWDWEYEWDYYYGWIEPAGLLDWFKCAHFTEQLAEENRVCRAEFNDSFESQIRFMSKYKSSFMDEALLKCTCTRAGAEKCAKWFKACAGMSRPVPRPFPAFYF